MITKTAINIMKMRDVVKNVVAPKFIRYAKNGRSAGDFQYHSPRALPFSNKQLNSIADNITRKAMDYQKVSDPEIAKATKREIMEAYKHIGALHGKRRHINWGNSALKNMRQFTNHTGETPGVVKNTMNDLLAMHENSELLTAPKALKVIKDKQLVLPNFASHFHPDVVLQEHNMLSTLKGASPKNIQAVKDNFKDMRTFSGEKPILDNYIPGGYTTGPRMNRRMRRHVYDKILKDYNPGYNPAKPKLTP